MRSNLRRKYCICGVGETEYSRSSGRTTRQMAVEAVKKAIEDAGLAARDIDGLLSYHVGDSTGSRAVATDLGIRPNFFMDCSGGGSSTEALIGLAMGAIETGLCNTVAIWRSMNGYSQLRMGRGGNRAARSVGEEAILRSIYGCVSPAQQFALVFMRYMHEYSVTNSQVASVRVAQSKCASNNPKALLRNRVSVADVLDSRWITKPLHLLDCCLETDNAVCIIVTSAQRANDLMRPPVYILGVAGRVCKPFPESIHHYGPITLVGGAWAAPRVFRMADVTPPDIDVTAAYDAFTFTGPLQFEAYGFCHQGEGGDYVSSGVIELGARRPNNTSGGQLCEGYTHGMNLVIELVRQLRGQADDYCPQCQEGIHTYDYTEGKCRQVKAPELAMSMGWANPGCGSALILGK